MKRIKGFIVALSLSIALASVCSMTAYCEESSESGETVRTISSDAGEDITNQDGLTVSEESEKNEENGKFGEQENPAQLFSVPDPNPSGH